MKNKAPITNCENARKVSMRFPADYCKFFHFFQMLYSRLSLNNDIVSMMPAISNKREYFVATTLYTITPERKIKNKKVSFYVKCFSLTHKIKKRKYVSNAFCILEIRINYIFNVKINTIWLLNWILYNFIIELHHLLNRRIEIKSCTSKMKEKKRKIYQS